MWVWWMWCGGMIFRVSWFVCLFWRIIFVDSCSSRLSRLRVVWWGGFILCVVGVCWIYWVSFMGSGVT